MGVETSRVGGGVVKWTHTYLFDVFVDHCRVNNGSLENVLHCVENDVSGQECFGDRNPSIGTIVQCAFEPLHGGRVESIGRQGDQVSGQGATAFASHRISFVGHRRRANLCVLERFLNLLAIGQKTDVAADLVDARAEQRKRHQHLGIDHSTVGLPGNRVGATKAGHFGDPLVQFLHLLLVPIEQLHKRGLKENFEIDHLSK